jgi:SAM-dependent methyltransferase
MANPAILDRLSQRLFPSSSFPRRIFQVLIRTRVRPGDVVLDAGCGRDAASAELCSAGTYIGVDLERPRFRGNALQGNLENLALRTESIDLAISDSVLEHVADPSVVFGEIHRVLKPGGRFIFLTPNLWHYTALVAYMVPNRWHPRIVRQTEGRNEVDTFPTLYRCNTAGAIRRFSLGRFRIARLQYLTQYPNYLSFNTALFALGSLYEKTLPGWLPPLRGWLLVELLKESRVVTTNL